MAIIYESDKEEQKALGQVEEEKEDPSTQQKVKLVNNMRLKLQAVIKGEDSIKNELMKQSKLEANNGRDGQERRKVPARRLFLDEDG